MVIRCKNTYGDGTVEYVEYEVEDYVPEEPDEDAEESDYIEALEELGVDLNEEE